MLKNLTYERRRLLALSLCGAAAPLLLLPRRARADEILKVAFVYVSPIGRAGWSYQHDLGRQAMEKALPGKVATRFVESVAEGPDSERVLRDLAGQGHKLIFATSFGYLEPALRVAAEFPDVRFEHAGGYKGAANLKTYNARYYEARYLAGMLAAGSSRSGIAGYVAGFPVPEVVQGINAFALGMREVNPKAELRVVWLDTWFDPARERDAALALIGQRADVLTNHSGSSAVPQAAEEKGVQLIAYQSDMSAFAPNAQIAAVTHHWGGYYTREAEALLAGRWSATPWWGGMRDGVVQLGALKRGLPAALIERVEAQRRAIAEGRFQPFSGRLVDAEGTLRQASGSLGDRAIASMDWFVQGVSGGVRGGAAK
jgi:basic membrane protein A and related proteins